LTGIKFNATIAGEVAAGGQFFRQPGAGETIMTTDLTMLVWSAVLTVVLFIPYIAARVVYWGLVDTVGYPENPPALPRWAERAKRAHVNLAENLAPFAALVLVAHVTQSANATTALGAAIFFWSRLVHAIVFIAGVPWARTLAFVVSIIGELLILSQLL
jgi:uncharacterized MAPEG superfamily protein